VCTGAAPRTARTITVGCDESCRWSGALHRSTAAVGIALPLIDASVLDRGVLVARCARSVSRDEFFRAATSFVASHGKDLHNSSMRKAAVGPQVLTSRVFSKLDTNGDEVSNALHAHVQA
jgi:hypothetical protein